MHSIEIPEIGQTLSFPEDGTEFNRSQLLALSTLMLYFNAKVINFTEFRVKLVYEFLNLKRTVDITKQENGQLLENIHQIAKLVDPYFSDIKEKGKPKKVLNMLFYNQLIPEIIVNEKKYIGCASALLNTKYGEYLQALTAFNDYSYTGEEIHLNRLIATLYRPETEGKAPGSFTRENFDPELTAHYAIILAKLAPQVKHAIYLFFASCQHFIANCSSLDIGGGNSIDLTVLFQKSGGGSSAKSIGMVGTLYTIAETKVFGTVKDVAAENTYDIFAFLVEQHHKMKELERQSKTKKK